MILYRKRLSQARVEGCGFYLPHCTISKRSVQVIAGVIPIDLLAKNNESSAQNIRGRWETSKTRRVILRPLEMAKDVGWREREDSRQQFSSGTWNPGSKRSTERSDSIDSTSECIVYFQSYLHTLGRTLYPNVCIVRTHLIVLYWWYASHLIYIQEVDTQKSGNTLGNGDRPVRGIICNIVTSLGLLSVKIRSDTLYHAIYEACSSFYWRTRRMQTVCRVYWSTSSLGVWK